MTLDEDDIQETKTTEEEAGAALPALNFSDEYRPRYADDTQEETGSVSVPVYDAVRECPRCFRKYETVEDFTADSNHIVCNLCVEDRAKPPAPTFQTQNPYLGK